MSWGLSVHCGGLQHRHLSASFLLSGLCPPLCMLRCLVQSIRLHLWRDMLCCNSAPGQIKAAFRSACVSRISRKLVEQEFCVPKVLCSLSTWPSALTRKSRRKQRSYCTLGLILIALNRSWSKGLFFTFCVYL